VHKLFPAIHTILLGPFNINIKSTDDILSEKQINQEPDDKEEEEH
jgi:hypothetical protein